MASRHPSYQTSNIFGDYEEEPKQQQRSRSQNQSQFSLGNDESTSGYAQPRTHETGVSDSRRFIKVHAAPGGNSSFSLGGYDEPEEKPQQKQQQQQQSTYSYAQDTTQDEQPSYTRRGNNNQSSFSLGNYEEPEQKSTGSSVQPRTHETGVSDSRRFIKVHAAPGGNSSFSLGGYDEPEEKPQQKQTYKSTSSFSLGGYEEEEAQVEKKQEQEQEQEQTTYETKGSYVQPRTHETGVSDSRRFVKVHQAPGGRSSIFLGNSEYNAFTDSENNSTANNTTTDEYAASFKKTNETTSGDWLSHDDNSSNKNVQQQSNTNQPHTSVRTSNPPGGKSSISFW